MANEFALQEGINSKISGHCHIEPGRSPFTSPKSSGCSMMNFPPAAWHVTQAAMHLSTNKFASSTTALWRCDNQGKPRGHMKFLNGLGPGDSKK
jgi:hypothetical protein